MSESVWLGVAVLALSEANPSRSEGYVGAYAVCASRAGTLLEAVTSLAREFEENNLLLLGFENMLPVERLDRELTAYERELVRATEEYPVQFKDVHFGKADA